MQKLTAVAVRYACRSFTDDWSAATGSPVLPAAMGTLTCTHTEVVTFETPSNLRAMPLWRRRRPLIWMTSPGCCNSFELGEPAELSEASHEISLPVESFKSTIAMDADV